MLQKQDTLSFLVSIKDKISDLDSVNDNLVEVPISVIVLDENDNAPIFQNVSTTYFFFFYCCINIVSICINGSANVQLYINCGTN